MMKELKFIHITKTAGTAIEKIGLSNKIEWGMNHKEYGDWHHYFPSKNPLLKDKYDWFMVVRNPYDRILSEYYCEWDGIGKKDIKHNKEEMNEYLIKKIKTYESKNKYGDHYSPQYKYLDSNYKIHIIKFENLSNEFDEVMKLYKLSYIKLNKKINSKEEKNNNIKYSVSDFSPKLIDLINNIYDKDFSTFAYTKM
jgi:hypothetical protein